MFGTIARRYDLLNHLLSFNLDRSWRRRTASLVALRGPGRVLDLCCGTGDLAVEAARAAPEGFVVGCDFSRPMLKIAGPKLRREGVSSRASLLGGDGLRLPFAEGSFDAVTVGFGVRNFVDRVAGFREILRVLKPEGRLVVLECSKPKGRVLGRLYAFYLNLVLPRIGESVSGRFGAYGYLARTIGDFPDPESLEAHLKEAGFASVAHTPLTGGIVCVHVALKGA